MHFTLPLNSPLLKLSEVSTSTSTTEQFTNFNRFQTPPLGAQSAGAPIMNSPYSRMCDQLEHFVDAESEVTDSFLFNRPLNERNGSVDLSPELERASMASSSNSNLLNLYSSNNYSSQQQQASSTPLTITTSAPLGESRSLWLGNVDPTVTEDEIRSVFKAFGTIENIRLLPAKECAFVNFYELESAIKGRNKMQGKALGNMILRIGFGKISDPKDSAVGTNISNGGGSSSLMFNSTQLTNQSRSVWIGNLGPEITCDLLMVHFNVFGPIESCRVLEAKNCAFVNFYSAEAATIAKTKMNGVLVGNSVIKTGNAKDTSNATTTISNNNNPVNLYNESIISLMKSNKPPTAPVPETFASIMAGENDQSEPELEDYDAMDGNKLREFRRAIESTPEEIPAILAKLIKNCDFKELAVDSYGNILLQKIIERAQISEKTSILHALKGTISEIAKHKNGTWVIQKLITAIDDSDKVQREAIEELKGQTSELLEDQFGNYVIQCILVTLPGDEENSKFIVEKIIQNSRKLALGKFSSRALKSILDSSTSERQKLLAQALAKESVLLSVDPNGAVVIQWILDSELPGKVSLVTGHLQGRLAQVALTKPGSVIVARIIGSPDEPKYRDSAILELYELSSFESSSSDPSANDNSFRTTSHLSSLLSEPSTCSILFKAYQLSKPAIRLRLAEKLRPRLMKLLIEITGEKDESRIESYGPGEKDEKIPVHLIKLYQELISKSH